MSILVVISVIITTTLFGPDTLGDARMLRLTQNGATPGLNR
jgi:hypothetical protein